MLKVLRKRCSPNTATVMAWICRFTPVSSSTTGLRAASAFSALFIKADLTLPWLWRFRLAGIWGSLADQRFGFPSCSVQPIKRQIYNELTVHIWSTKHITSYALDTWGLMHICSLSEISTSPKYNTSINLGTWGLMCVFPKTVGMGILLQSRFIFIKLNRPLGAIPVKEQYGKF